MKLLHFSKGNQEYIVLTETDDDPSDFQIPGYEFVTVCDVTLSNFTVGDKAGLPIDVTLEGTDR